MTLSLPHQTCSEYYRHCHASVPIILTGTTTDIATDTGSWQNCAVSYAVTSPVCSPRVLMYPLVCRSHLILRNLRPPGSKEYVIPKGFAFNYITCANYTFEIYGWVLFGVATQTVAAFMFIAAGSLPMTQWALAKHKRLRKVSGFSVINSISYSMLAFMSAIFHVTSDQLHHSSYRTLQHLYTSPWKAH